MESKLLIAATETKQFQKTESEWNKVDEDLNDELKKVPVTIRDSIEKSQPKGKAIRPATDAKRTLANQAVQMAARNDPGWFDKPGYRAALQENVREQFPELDPAAVTNQRELYRAGALQAKKAQLEDLPVIPIFSVSIAFNPNDPEFREPLSWKLTPRQNKVIDDAWNRIRNGIRNKKDLPPALSDKIEARELKDPAQLNHFFKLR